MDTKTTAKNTPRIFRTGGRRGNWAIEWWHGDDTKPNVSDMPDKATAALCLAAPALLTVLKRIRNCGTASMHIPLKVRIAADKAVAAAEAR